MRTNLSEKIVVPGRRLNLKRIQTRSFRHEYVYFCRARKTLRADEQTGRGAPADHRPIRLSGPTSEEMYSGAEWKTTTEPGTKHSGSNRWTIFITYERFLFDIFKIVAGTRPPLPPSTRARDRLTRRRTY